MHLARSVPQAHRALPASPGLETISTQSANDSTGAKVLSANCPAGKRLLGGGARIVGAAGLVAVDESYPLTATQWRATATEIVATGVNWYVNAYAICATVA